MFPRKKLTLALVAATAFAAPLSSMAYEKGDWIVRAGAANVDPDASSDAIVIPTMPETVLPNGVDVEDDTQLGLTVSYMFTNTLSVELLASTPFDHDIVLEDAPIDAGSTKHLPPTVTLNWYPRGGQDGWQPYIGLGLNYTTFFDESVDGELEAALGEIVGLPGPLKADLDLDDSWGLAVRAGVDVSINERWSVNASMYWIDIDTEATISTAVADVNFDVEIDPYVWMLGVAYRF